MARCEDTSRDLLFGLLALQTGLIDQFALVAAFHAWSRDKAPPMAEVLESQGAIDSSRRALLERLAAEHPKVRGGGPEESTVALDPAGFAPNELRFFASTKRDPALDPVGSEPTRTGGPGADDTISLARGLAKVDGQRFRVLRPYARGGLGTVFVALDQELHREVALKEIHDRHADDATSRARFVLEAEITGGLEHPGIVPVYGLGTYANGRPYYAMRFIRGDSLKQAIAAFHVDPALKRDPGARGLALRKLLRRFLDVCNAIDYAHGRGVLHRDLKPSNVIVGRYGETLVVDWGLAKATGLPDPCATSQERPLVVSSASGSAHTLAGSALGTPAYMSPEQASGDTANLGPRTDVYSLGATLYCLLTGKPPFPEGDAATVLEAVRVGAFVAPRQVDPSIDPALEAVCKKAMALKPDDRYGSPRALAEEIDRWMADEPVSARREPLAARMRRWMRRRRTAVTAAAAAVLVALFGLAVVLAVQARANRDLRAANERERLRFDVALEAIRAFHTGVSEDVLLKQQEFEELRNKLLRTALDFYKKLEGLLSAHSDRGSRAALGRAYFEVADLTEKIGSKDVSLQTHRRALAVRRTLARESGADPAAQAEVGRSLLAIGMLLSEMGQMADARAADDEARSLLERLVRSEPGVPAFQADLAVCYHRFGVLFSETGRPTEALQAYDRAIAIRAPLASAHPNLPGLERDLAWSYSNVGNLFAATGRPGEALAAHERARAIRETLASVNPSDLLVQSDLAGTYMNIGNVLARKGRLAEAMASYQRALVIREALAKANPTVTGFQASLAFCHQGIGDLLVATGHPSEALAAFEHALAIRASLARSYPTVPRNQTNLAESHASIGDLYALTGRPAEALEAHQRALAIRDALARSNPAATVFQRDLAASHHAIGAQLLAKGHPAEALASFERALAIREPLARDNPTLTRLQDDLAASHTSRADVLLATGRPAEALASYERAIALRATLARDNSSMPGFRSHLVDTLRRNTNARQALGPPAEAIAAYRRTIGILEGLPGQAPNDLYDLACFHARLGALASVNSGVASAEVRAGPDRAIEYLRLAIAAGYRNLFRLQIDPDLHSLRAQPEFQALLMDLAFPDWPFTAESPQLGPQ
jgi:eukaryotic-like serine/threonine-protein kinase